MSTKILNSTRNTYVCKQIGRVSVYKVSSLVWVSCVRVCIVRTEVKTKLGRSTATRRKTDIIRRGKIIAAEIDRQTRGRRGRGLIARKIIAQQRTVEQINENMSYRKFTSEYTA